MRALEFRGAPLAALVLLVTVSAAAAAPPSTIRAPAAATGDKGFWSGIATSTETVKYDGGEFTEKITVKFGAPGGSIDNPASPETWFQPFAMSASYIDKRDSSYCAKGEASWAPTTKVTGSVHSRPDVGVFSAEPAQLQLPYEIFPPDCTGPSSTFTRSVPSVFFFECGGSSGVGICEWSDGGKTVSGAGTVREYGWTGRLAFTRLPDCDQDGIPDIHDKDDSCTHAPPPPPPPGKKKKVLTEPWKGTVNFSATAEGPVQNGAGRAGFTLNMKATFNGRADGKKKDALGTLKWTFSGFNTKTATEGEKSCTWKGSGSYPVITEIFLADDPDDELPPSRAFIFSATGIVTPVQWGVLNKNCDGGASESKVYYAKEGPGVKGVEFNIAPSARRVSKTIHPAVVWPMGRFLFPPGVEGSGRITFSRK